MAKEKYTKKNTRSFNYSSRNVDKAYYTNNLADKTEMNINSLVSQPNKHSIHSYYKLIDRINDNKKQAGYG